ncbi:hypothetical protein [Pimelobacter simplex]|uniref:hypothetical protein n=1 Tax=Nocardioides simplex TaxID=2045 RepID=UPI00193244E6|nr:hypothetical protein [Pimelobacter simplex]
MVTLFVVDVPPDLPNGSAVVRVHDGTLRLGHRFTRIEVAGVEHAVDLECTQIWRYEGVAVETLESNFGGRVNLVGNGAQLIQRESTLIS